MTHSVRASRGALLALSFGLAVLGGCSSSSTLQSEEDASPDAAGEDGATSDASVDSTVVDGAGADGTSPVPDGSTPDAQTPDSTLEDGSQPEGSQPDAADGGQPDAAVGDGGLPDASKTDAGAKDASSSNDASTSDAGTHDAGAADAGEHDSGLTAVNVCDAGSATLGWTASIAATASTLSLVDVAVSQTTNDVIVADLSGGSTFEQHRWSSAGAAVSVHQDQDPAYTGTLWTSGLFADTQNDVFYGMLETGLVEGTNSGVDMIFTRLAADGTVDQTWPMTADAPTSSGAPAVTYFQVGGDNTTNLHGTIVMTPQTIGDAVYCYLYDGTVNGPNAQNVLAFLGPTGFLWPTPDNNLGFFQPLTATTNFGCSSDPLTVPAGGGIALAKFSGRGDCQWDELLALPTAAIKSSNFRSGLDGSLDVAVSYSGTINFGNKSLTSTGTSSLALARFDTNGNLVWSETFGGTGSSFTVGSLAVNGAGLMVLTGRYGGTVDLGHGPLPSSNDTVLATFNANGALQWTKTVTVGAEGGLLASAGPCGPAIATNSPNVDFGTGPLSVVSGAGPASIGVAALAW